MFKDLTLRQEVRTENKDLQLEIITVYLMNLKVKKDKERPYAFVLC